MTAFFAIVVAVSLPSMAAIAAEPATLTGKVVRVHDGDTLTAVAQHDTLTAVAQHDTRRPYGAPKKGAHDERE